MREQLSSGTRQSMRTLKDILDKADIEWHQHEKSLDTIFWSGSDGDYVATRVSDTPSCATCPAMDDPDSYISHLHNALRWHDNHVPRPTDEHVTSVVLEGKRKPDEVLFISSEGATRYVPEDAATSGVGMCHIILREDIHDGAYHDVYECDRCGEQMSVGTVMGKSEPPNFCIRCGGRRIEV